jgi:hypothetical protein
MHRGEPRRDGFVSTVTLPHERVSLTQSWGTSVPWVRAPRGAWTWPNKPTPRVTTVRCGGPKLALIALRLKMGTRLDRSTSDITAYCMGQPGRFGSAPTRPTTIVYGCQRLLAL